MSDGVPFTPLQEAVGCAFGCWQDARERLGDDAWCAYVAVVLELSRREAGRLAVGEAIRATREGEE